MHVADNECEVHSAPPLNFLETKGIIIIAFYLTSRNSVPQISAYRSGASHACHATKTKDSAFRTCQLEIEFIFIDCLALVLQLPCCKCK
jgi:hypothetical protein